MTTIARSGWRSACTAPATSRKASMSRPESVSSSTAKRGSSTDICKISLRFFSPPENPSFTINVSSGSGGGANVVSFPSIYIGGNGQIGASGAYNTWTDSGLPKQISAIKSAKSTFQWSGGNGGNYNAAYDIWFSSKVPTAGSYNDGISGLLMI